jgi:hypothetical protein
MKTARKQHSAQRPAAPPPDIDPDIDPAEAITAGILPEALEKAIQAAIRQSMTDQPGELPAYMRTNSARQAFQAAFETIGGMPRLAIWAHYNYRTFVQLYSRLIPLTLAGDEDHPIRVIAPWLNGARFQQPAVIEQATTVVHPHNPKPDIPRQQLALPFDDDEAA